MIQKILLQYIVNMMKNLIITLLEITIRIMFHCSVKVYEISLKTLETNIRRTLEQVNNAAVTSTVVLPCDSII